MATPEALQAFAWSAIRSSVGSSEGAQNFATNGHRLGVAPGSPIDSEGLARLTSMQQQYQASVAHPSLGVCSPAGPYLTPEESWLAAMRQQHLTVTAGAAPVMGAPGGSLGICAASNWLAAMRERHAATLGGAPSSQAHDSGSYIVPTLAEGEDLLKCAHLSTRQADISTAATGHLQKASTHSQAGGTEHLLAGKLHNERIILEGERQRFAEATALLTQEREALQRLRNDLEMERAKMERGAKYHSAAVGAQCSTPIVESSLTNVARPIVNGENTAGIPREHAPGKDTVKDYGMSEYATWLANDLRLSVVDTDIRKSASGADQGGHIGVETTTSQEPAVIIEATRFLPTIRAALPGRTYGIGPCIRHFGLLIGRRKPQPKGSFRIAVEIDDVDMFDQSFRWDQPMHQNGASESQRVSELTAELNSSLKEFVEHTFGPWARGRIQEVSHDQLTESPRAVGWLVCNEGEAFGLAQPFIEAPRLIDGSGDEEEATEDRRRSEWTEVLVVCDVAKSSETEAALEVFKLWDTATKLPERLLFDVRKASRVPTAMATAT